ncbi:MAG: response regulator, partial [Planctomycetota bacterium]
MIAVPQILVSDDDSAFREVVCESLARRGFRVTEAIDGKQAIELWRRDDGDFHLCLVDFHMPGANGLEVVRFVQSYQPAGQSQGDEDCRQPTPCVLMSAELTDPIRREAESAQVFRVLSKPL